MRYIISYDLNNPGRNQQAVTNALTKLGAKRILFSQWILRHSNTTPMNLVNHLRAFGDSNDRWLVTEFDGAGAAWFNPMTDPNTV